MMEAREVLAFLLGLKLIEELGCRAMFVEADVSEVVHKL